MEAWCLCAHGTMRTLFEKFYTDSDGMNIPICRNCGNTAIVNEKEPIYKCRICKDKADIANVASSWVANIFWQELSAMNVKMKLELEPHTYPRTQE